MADFMMIIIILAVIAYAYYLTGDYEAFDKDMLEFPPLGEKRYDMAGRLLSNRPMCDCLCDKYGTCYAGNNY